MGVPGLKVVVPSTPADAKGLMIAASIRDDNPVVFFHNYLMTLEHGDVPEGEHVVPLGEAVVRREGSDVTIVGIGWTVGKALAAADSSPPTGSRRSRRPADARRSTSPIVQSVEKTGRLVVVDQATRHASAAAVIAAEVASEGFSALKAPIGLVTALDATIPYSQPMEEYLMPSESGSSPRCNRRSAPRPSPPERGRDADGGARRGPRPRELLRHVADPRVRGARRAADPRGRGARPRAPERRQEAVAVGVCGRLSDDDAVYSNHRARARDREGRPLGRVMAELMGRDGGLCRGLGGSMHLVDVEHGFLGATGVVGNGVPLALGSALAGRLAGRDEVAVVFFGDGAVREASSSSRSTWRRCGHCP